MLILKSIPLLVLALCVLPSAIVLDHDYRLDDAFDRAQDRFFAAESVRDFAEMKRALDDSDKALKAHWIGRSSCSVPYGCLIDALEGKDPHHD